MVGDSARVKSIGKSGGIEIRSGKGLGVAEESVEREGRASCELLKLESINRDRGTGGGKSIVPRPKEERDGERVPRG